MKRVCIVLSFLLSSVFLHGQYDTRENFYDAEFFFAEEDYPEALYAFSKVYQDGYQDNSNINYRMGVCLLEIDDRKTEAIPYLEKAIENITSKYREGSFKEENAPADAYLYLGNAYRINNQCDIATESYKQFLEYSRQDANLVLYAQLQIKACETASDLTEQTDTYNVGTLGQINMINAPVYNPAISGDLSTFAFMGRQRFYNGINISRKQDGKWLKPYNITPSVQSDGNQTVLSLSHDGNKLLLSMSNEYDSDIWITEYKNNRWLRSEPIGKPVNSKYYESHACFTPDGNSIYFTSNRRESIGDMDIFRCDLQKDGSWGSVVQIGENLNTSLNEENPFVSPDGTRLYFSSQGHPGLGGFDIYYCEIREDGTYGEPVHLDYPLNTRDDDYAFTPNLVEFENSLAMYAKGDEGQVDIFRFEWIPESAQPVIVAFESSREAGEVDREDEKPGAMDEQVSATGEEPGDEAMESEDAESGFTEDITETTGEDEMADVAQEPDRAAEEVPDDDAVIRETTGQYVIRPVFFDFDSFRLTPATTGKLDEIAAIMLHFPNIQLQITGHTDAVGAEPYNYTLAGIRARAVGDYLISKGIAKSRLTLVSKGETNPTALNRSRDNRDAPEGRALNRRVHFSVTVPNGIYLEVEDVRVPEHLKIN